MTTLQFYKINFHIFYQCLRQDINHLFQLEYMYSLRRDLDDATSLLQKLPWPFSPERKPPPASVPLSRFLFPTAGSFSATAVAGHSRPTSGKFLPHFDYTAHHPSPLSITRRGIVDW
jgi:hypothetical protein